MRNQRYAETLRQAARIVGGEAKLAHFLMVPERKLARWMAGREPAPLDVFLSALEIIGEPVGKAALSRQPARLERP